MILQSILRVLQVYKRYLSPLLPQQCCRFTPTCSEYAMDAFEHHGLFFGLLFTTFRLLRCHPFASGGFDPIYLSAEPQRSNKQINDALAFDPSYLSAEPPAQSSNSFVEEKLPLASSKNFETHLF